LRRQAFLAAATVILAAADIHSAIAQPLAMTCTNPRRGYLVSFDAEKRSFVARAEEGPTPYAVTSFTRSGSQTIVSGRTPNGGPSFTAYFGSRPRIEFNTGNGIQTDLCSTTRFR